MSMETPAGVLLVNKTERRFPMMPQPVRRLKGSETTPARRLAR
jgi:hypothetical protein